MWPLKPLFSELRQCLASFSAPLPTHLPGELSRSQILFKAEEASVLHGRGRRKEHRLDSRRVPPGAVLPLRPAALPGDVLGCQDRVGAGNTPGPWWPEAGVKAACAALLRMALLPRTVPRGGRPALEGDSGSNPGSAPCWIWNDRQFIQPLGLGLLVCKTETMIEPSSQGLSED